MNREQKIEYLKNAGNAEILYQIGWSAERRQAAINAGNLEAEIKSAEDFQLALEKALRRMER